MVFFIEDVIIRLEDFYFLVNFLVIYMKIKKELSDDTNL